MVNLAANAMSDPDLLLNSPLIGEELTRTLAHAALRTFPNSTLTTQYQSGPGATAPATIRRALAHLEANAHLPVQLVAAAGTSTRALQYGFRRHLGTTPLEHLRRVRLEHPHHDLAQADPTKGETVTAIAARWGFVHPGRFAAAYTAAYGTPPSHTLHA